MQLTIAVKLRPTPKQHAALLQTMERFNAACDRIAETAFAEKSANKVRLQQLIYADIRRDFGLSSQMTIRAIAKVCEVYKRDKSIKPAFRPHGAIVYDQRILSWKGLDRVSILTLDGREIVPVVMGHYQAARMTRVRGQADLVYRDGTFYLHAIVDLPDIPTFKPTGFLGVDLGIKNIAADSDGITHSGAVLNALRARHSRLRARLQRKGTKSAKRLLKKRRRKERRFAANTNHCIAKRIVRKAFDTQRGIAIEDLKGIRDRVKIYLKSPYRYCNVRYINQLQRRFSIIIWQRTSRRPKNDIGFTGKRTERSFVNGIAPIMPKTEKSAVNRHAGRLQRILKRRAPRALNVTGAHALYVERAFLKCLVGNA